MRSHGGLRNLAFVCLKRTTPAFHATADMLNMRDNTTSQVLSYFNRQEVWCLYELLDQQWMIQEVHVVFDRSLHCQSHYLII
jgi:hypothetical protein